MGQYQATGFVERPARDEEEAHWLPEERRVSGHEAP